METQLINVIEIVVILGLGCLYLGLIAVAMQAYDFVTKKRG